jgi:hypothetical protein
MGWMKLGVGAWSIYRPQVVGGPEDHERAGVQIGTAEGRGLPGKTVIPLVAKSARAG